MPTMPVKLAGWRIDPPVSVAVAPSAIRAATAAADPPVKLPSLGNAVVMYRHLVTPKEGAATLLKGAGGEPLLVGKGYGQGRVAVFSGTVMGEPPAGSQAFWETDAWKTELAKAIAWVAGK